MSKEMDYVLKKIRTKGETSRSDFFMDKSCEAILDDIEPLVVKN